MAAAGALGACCLAAVGCGGAAPDPLANQTGTQVLAEAVANLKAAPSVTLNFATIESDQFVTVNVAIVPGKGCTGSDTVDAGGTWAIVTFTTIGKTVYFKPDSTFWQTLAGSNAAKVTRTVDGRYVKVPLTDNVLQGLASCVVTGPDPDGKIITKGQVTTLNGVRVLPLNGSNGGVTYVTDTSKPEFVQVDHAPVPGTTDPAGETTVTFGPPVKLTAPPASQVVSGASIHM